MVNHPLLQQLIDYAGLFPPASLSMEEAVPEYAAHLGEPEAWMLGRFICPAGALPDLLPHASLFRGSPLRVCVLPGADGTLIERVASAAQKSDAFERSFSGSANVEVFEARVSTAIAVDDMLRAGSAAGSRTLYLEWRPDRDDLEELLGTVGSARSRGQSNLGAKIRCGGVTPDAFPSVTQVARFIAACAREAVPFKATAGLHHPVRHDRDGFTMHGFLNVFGATVLAAVHGLDAAALEPVLAERDPGAFDLSAGGFAWRSLTADSTDIVGARQLLAQGFGSCSFNEPREDLEEAGWFGLAQSA